MNVRCVASILSCLLRLPIESQTSTDAVLVICKNERLVINMYEPNRIAFVWSLDMPVKIVKFPLWNVISNITESLPTYTNVLCESCISYECDCEKCINFCITSSLVIVAQTQKQLYGRVWRVVQLICRQEAYAECGSETVTIRRDKYCNTVTIVYKNTTCIEKRVIQKGTATRIMRECSVLMMKSNVWAV